MNLRIPSLVLSLLPTLSMGAISLQGEYFENFNTTLDSNHWTLSSMGVRSYVDGGRTTVTSGGGIYGGITGTPAFTPTYPLPALVTPSSYKNYGFSGSWLSTLGAGGENNIATNVSSATVQFNQLGGHQKIDHISFLVGAGDSLDGAREGILEVSLGGQVIFRRSFESHQVRATPDAAFPDVTVGNGSKITTLATGGNLLGEGFYSETWNDGATDPSQRYVQNWTTEGAYRVDLFDLPHTGDLMDLTFTVYGVNSGPTDEFVSIDNLYINVPEPSRALLLLGAIPFLRRRSRP